MDKLIIPFEFANSAISDGPWIATPKKGDVPHDEWHEISDPFGNIVVNVDGYCDHPMNKANARLISLAPEMLLILVRFVAALNGMKKFPSKEAYWEANEGLWKAFSLAERVVATAHSDSFRIADHAREIVG